ncbi:Snf7 family protein [Nitzschia inconspicua]|uniref:Snf7 family protein n=1 Tax=Nitzschia inconspicua TaxID=303405 RepID=A0A9K3Q868_9STRA|nr:Snf7 family protein [Nitzschia inconspicua]
MFFNNMSAYQDGQAFAMKLKAMQDRQARDGGPQPPAVVATTSKTNQETGSLKKEQQLQQPQQKQSKHSTFQASSRSSSSRNPFFGWRSKPKSPEIETVVTSVPATTGTPSETSSITTTTTVSASASSSSLYSRRPILHSSSEKPREEYMDPKLVQAEQTLQFLNDTIASQERRDDHLGQEIAALLLDAKAKHTEGNKRGAIRQLKKMKLKQHEQTKVGHTIETMEAQALTIESAIETAKVLQAMKRGANTTKSLQHGKETSVEAFDDVLEDIKYTMDYAAEIQQILSEPVGNVILDEDELLQELERCMDDDVDTPPISGSATSMMVLNMPTAPQSVIHPRSGSSDEETAIFDPATLMAEV